MISRDKLRELYVDGNMTMAETGVALGASTDVVGYWLRKHGLPIRKHTKKKREVLTMSCVCRNCPVCGIDFYRQRSQLIKGSCCSRKCADLRKIRDIDMVSVIDMYKSGMSSIEIADEIGMSGSGVIKSLKRAGVEVRGRGDHMSTDKNPTKGKGHTDETRQKLRDAALKQFSDPKAREGAAHKQVAHLERTERCVSSLERKVAEELDRLGIKYETSKGIRDPKTGRFCACVDFFINGKALEVNGTYYHSDPRVYPDGPKTYTQRHNAEKYENKSSHLNYLGIPLFEVWEMDIDRDLPMTVKNIITEMGEI